MLQQERTMSKLFAPGDFLLASPRRGLAQRVGNGHAARFEICNIGKCESTMFRTIGDGPIYSLHIFL